MIKTPFRYPGAKNKLLPALMAHIEPLVRQHNIFVDGFVGGGSVLLEVAEKFPNINLYANDKDLWMYSFWKIVSELTSLKMFELFDLIDTKPTLELFYKLRETPPTTDVECAYRAIFFNRTTFSGIFYSGPIGGKEQKSQYTVDCRYNAKKLKSKIQKCHDLLKGRTYISNCDILSYDPLIKEDVPIYLDPPYYHKGDALYIEKMTGDDHQKLAQILWHRKNWVLSYDDCPEIRELYKLNNNIDLSARYSINGKKETWENKNELIILP